MIGQDSYREVATQSQRQTIRVTSAAAAQDSIARYGDINGYTSNCKYAYRSWYLVVQEDTCGWQCSLIRLIDAVKFVQSLTLISDCMLVTHI